MSKTRFALNSLLAMAAPEALGRPIPLKGNNGTLSLTVLLPVHNAQATLVANVQRVIDILPELTTKFEVLVVDDGSADATCEVAYELASSYPQIIVIRHAEALGWTETVSREITRGRGEFLMIHGGGPIDPDDIVGLWRLREGIAAAASAFTRSSSVSTSAKSAAMEQRLTLHVPLADDPRPRNRVRKLPSILASTRARSGRTDSPGALGVHARAPQSNLLLIHRRQLAELERSLTTMPKTPWPAAPRRTRRHGPDRVRAPSFLTLVKKFALGE